MSPEVQTLLYGEELSVFEAFGLTMGAVFLLTITLLLLFFLYAGLYSLIELITRPIVRQRDRRQQQKQAHAKEQYDKRWRKALRYPPPADLKTNETESKNTTI